VKIGSEAKRTFVDSVVEDEDIDEDEEIGWEKM
jgi:hypothetical protein